MITLIRLFIFAAASMAMTACTTPASQNTAETAGATGTAPNSTHAQESRGPRADLSR